MKAQDRLDYLANIAVDREQSLSEEQWLELESLTRDEQNWERYRQLVDTEVILRGMDERTDLCDEVMARLDALSGDRRIVPFPRIPRAAALTAAAAVIAALAAVLLWPSSSGVEIPLLTSSEGTVITEPQGDGTRFTVSSESSAAWRFADGTEIAALPSTTLVFGQALADTPAAGKLLSLSAGTIDADVAPQPRDHPLVIATPHADAIVRGTRFRLITDAESTRLKVFEGRVDLVDHRGSSVAVAAGESGTAATGQTVAKGMLRVPLTPLVLYDFSAGSGRVIRDRSGTEPELNLVPSDPAATIDWQRDGVRLDGSSFFVSESTASALVERCRASNEVTFEAWLTPELSTIGGPARIITVSRGSSPRSVMLAQGQFRLNAAPGFIGRTPTDGAEGTSRLPLSVASSPSILTHLVLTHAADGERTLYVNGESVASDTLPGSFSNWPTQFPLSIGGDLENANRGGEPRTWRGVLHLIAIFDAALDASEVLQNYRAGHAP